MGADAGTAEFVAVCAVEDLWEGEMEAFDVGDTEVLVLNAGGTFHAYDAICPHQSVPLVEGTFENGVLTCRAHQWTFDACTGRGLNPCSEELRRYPIRIVDGQVQVQLTVDE
jgi:toluene monooxygenase system ferredoxin subunit